MRGLRQIKNELEVDTAEIVCKMSSNIMEILEFLRSSIHPHFKFVGEVMGPPTKAH